ncbi:MAG: iron-siderophore ABC transporter substrate-binding protein [Cyanobacteria bacterium P01_D01_bin.36]
MGETCVPDDPKRIIALYTPPLAALLSLDSKPIGLTPVTAVADEFPSYLADKVQGIEIVGLDYEPNLEKITQLKPDLILGWDHHEQASPILSKIAPTILTQPDGEPSSGDEWKEYFSFVAEAIGKQDIAQQVLDKYNQRIAQMQAAIGNQYVGKAISVAQVTEKYGIEVYTKNSFSGSILSELGLERPKLQDVIKPRGVIEAISAEKLELIDGDILFVLNFNKDDRELLNDLLKDPLWKTLRAVQNNQIYPVDGWTWVVANPLAADAILDDLYKPLSIAP